MIEDTRRLGTDSLPVETAVTAPRAVSVADTVVEGKSDDLVLSHLLPIWPPVATAVHVVLCLPVGVYGLQDPLPGPLNLLHSPGGPGSAGDVDRVQAGPGVWLLLPGEVVFSSDKDGAKQTESQQIHSDRAVSSKLLTLNP